jgi:hypothetical protein
VHDCSPSIENEPAVHSPLGYERLAEAQYFPAGQSLHDMVASIKNDPGRQMHGVGGSAASEE